MGNSIFTVPQKDGVFQGRYEIVRSIRSGAMGSVYEVIHLETRRRGALKVMHPGLVSDPDLCRRFKLEARVTAEIEGDHIVRTYDAGVDAETGTPFLVMELLGGEDLASMLVRRGALPPSEAVLLLRQLAIALDRAHAAGIVHRDIKPGNLFLTKGDDGSPRLKVLDFGIAKVMEESLHSASTTLSFGTPLYMSPEQIEGDGSIGPAADLYALGHVAYSLLVGEAFWTAEAKPSHALFAKILSGKKEPATTRALIQRSAHLPSAFDDWFAKATALEPERRFDTAARQVDALAAVLDVPLPAPSLPGHAGPPVVVEGEATIGAVTGPQRRLPTADPSGPKGGPARLMLVLLALGAIAGSTWMALRPATRDGRAASPDPQPLSVLTLRLTAAPPGPIVEDGVASDSRPPPSVGDQVLSSTSASPSASVPAKLPTSAPRPTGPSGVRVTSIRSPSPIPSPDVAPLPFKEAPGGSGAPPPPPERAPLPKEEGVF